MGGQITCSVERVVAIRMDRQQERLDLCTLVGCLWVELVTLLMEHTVRYLTVEGLLGLLAFGFCLPSAFTRTPSQIFN